MKRITLFFAALAIVATACADVITQQPQGTLKTYNREGMSVVNEYDYGFYVAYQEGKVSIVFADGGKVYMKDPLYAGLLHRGWCEECL